MNRKLLFAIDDNQDITRAGLRGYISSLFPAAQIAEPADRKALASTLSDCPDAVVILDYTLSDFNSVDELLVMVKRFQHAQWILFSAELSETFLRRVSGEDNIGIILKENSADEIISALQAAADRRRYICRQIESLLAGAPSQPDIAQVLTPTEIEILRLIARGKTVKEIAAERISSIHTVITHKKNIFRKLGVNNVYEATKYAIRAGILEMMEYYI